MQFKKVVLASFLALSLVACGDNDDKSKPDDDNKTKEPPKTEECIKAGDKCVLEDGKWVIKKEEEEEPAPEVDTEFDYSAIGVTDKLEPVRRGFGFYHKGKNSPLDAKRFSKNKPTLAPIVNWSSALDYDVDLWNFVAITPHSKKASSKGAKKYMFDEIGEHNQKENPNLTFFGTAAVSATAGGVGKSSYDSTNGYLWNRVPAVVNTFIYKDKEGKFVREYSDATGKKSAKIWFNEEADEQDSTNGGGSGKQSSRIYGVNAFLESADNTKVIKTNGEANGGTPKEQYELVNRTKELTGKEYYIHANFVYWKPEDRTSQATSDGSSIVPATDEYGAAPKKKFPTDLQLGALNYAQFGRLSGAGVSPSEPDMLSKYNDPKLREYHFFKTGGKTVAAGSKKVEDWYFARGTLPTPIEKLEEIKNNAEDEDYEIAYDGQALMFGLNYDPVKKAKVDGSNQSDDDISTNAVKPSGSKFHQQTILDGKQDLVRIKWNPSSGEINGGVFGVWTTASYWVALKDINGGPSKGQIIKLKPDGYEVVPDLGSAGGVAYPTKYEEAKTFIENATHIGVLQNTLVSLKGKVIEGTNSFAGVAERCNNQCGNDEVENSKGIFVGAFFGPDANEVAGLINSQTGSMKDPELSDPDMKWGGSFGAQHLFKADETREYLDFPRDDGFDYNATFERY